MKKLIGTCIVLTILRITCQYTETVGVYQTEVTKAEMISAHNDIVLWDAVAMAGQSDWSGVRRLINITNNRREYGKAIDIYYPLLAEYERAWKDKDYQDEYGFIMSDSRFRNCSSREHKSLCFALADLADDGSVELVIGVKSDGKYIICTIYSYDGDSIYCADMGADGDRTLYETGIYEVFRGMRGVALFDYYQFKEDLQQAEFVIGLTQSYVDEKYYKYMEPENSDNIEITEEEFWEIREQYEKSLIELDWQELKGYALNHVPEIDGYYPEEEHVIARKKKVYESGKLESEYIYDRAGNEIETIFYSNSGKVMGRRECEYDESGNEIKYITYNMNGSIDGWRESRYDENNNKIEMISNQIDAKICERHVYEYDEAGNEIKEILYIDDSMYRCCETKYDAAERKIEYINYDNDGVIFRNVYEYEQGENGSRCELVSYNSDGKIRFSTEYEYDKAGNCTMYIDYMADGSMFEWQEYEYDEAGNRIKTIHYNSDGNIESWEKYEYDETGNKVKYEEYSGLGELVSECKWEYTYDKFGNLAEIKTNGKVSDRYEYEYAYVD